MTTTNFVVFFREREKSKIFYEMETHTPKCGEMGNEEANGLACIHTLSGAALQNS